MMRALAALLLVFFATFAPPAAATLISVDGGNVTRDTSSGLDWLDLTLTAGLSYNEILAGAGGWLDAGWRYATGSELCSMVRSEGFTFLDQFNSCPGIPGYINAGIGARNQEWPEGYFFGVTEPVFGQIIGQFDDETINAADAVGLGAFGPRVVTSFGTRGMVTILGDYFDSNTGAPDRGSFLVRPVPEPATGTLLGLALFGLAADRKRRQRRA